MSFLCVTFVTYTNGDKAGDRGDSGQGYPSPFQGRTHERLPPSKFFIFFLPYPIISPIHPFFLLLRCFLFLCVYFPIRVPFLVSEGKKRGKYELIFLSCLCLCCYYTLYSHSIFSFSIIFPPVFPLLFCSPCYVFVVTIVFFADLPILLPSVGLSPLLCVIIRLGVFRGSEAKNLGFVLWLGSIYTEKGRTRLS